MADLTSKYRDKNLRDVSMQACLKAIEKGYINYPENYIVGKFTDFFDIQGGTQPPKSKFVYKEENGFIRFLQIRDFSSENTLTYIPVDSKNKLCEEKDILLGRYGASVGKILTGKSGAYNVACAKVVVLDNKKIDQQYLFYLLHSTTIQNFIKNISRSAQGGFNKGDLNKIELVIPKIEWQRKLLAILQEIDAFLVENKEIDFTKYKEEFIKYLIALFRNQLNVIKQIEELTNQHDSQKSLLQQLRQSILQEAVQGKLVPQDANDEPAEQLLQRIKAEKARLIKEGKLKKEKELPPLTEEEIPFELPKGWVWCRFGQCSINKDGDRIPLSESERKLRQGNYDYYGAQGVIDKIDNYIFEKTLLLIAEDGGNLLRRSKPVAYLAHGKFWVNNHAHVIDTVDQITMRYLEIYINSIDLKPYLNGEPPMQIKLNQGKLITIPVALPPLLEQQRIFNKVELLKQHINFLEQQVKLSKEQSQQLLQTILREAFTSGQKEYAENEMLTMAAEE